MTSDHPSPIRPAALRAGCGITEGWFGALVIVILTVLVYYPALRGEFVWDDNGWVGASAGNLLRDASGLGQMWGVPGTLHQYFPLTGTTFWLDHLCWAGWTLPYHLENVLLHSVSAVLFWRLLRRLDVPGAWMAGAVFALHPVMVESTAWITERKNVLSQVLFLGALLQYGKFASYWTDTVTARRWTIWFFAMFLFLAAMLAKISTFSLPACILLICWWKRGRIRWKDDTLPVLPFFALATGLGLIAVWMELFTVGAHGADWNLSWTERLLVAGRAPWFYLGTLLWPAGLCSVYPLWHLDVSEPAQWLYPASFALLIILLWTVRRRIGRGPVVAILFFTGTLLPVLGFMNVYGMRYSFVADRWVYLPSLGIIALVVALVVRCTEVLGKYWVRPALACLVLPSLAVITWQHARTFQNEFTLWQSVIKRNPECWVAHANLGAVHLYRGSVDEAVQHFQMALDIRWDVPLTHIGFARALQKLGRLEEAAGHYEATLKIDPAHWLAHKDYAALLMKIGRGGEALVHTYYMVTLPTAEKRWDGLMALAWILGTCSDASLRDSRLAVELAQRANRLTNFGNPEVLQILAAAYAEAGRFKEAVETAQRALTISHQQALKDDIQTQLNFYLRSEPFRDEKGRYMLLPTPPKR